MNYLKTYNKLFATYGYNNHTHREPRFLFVLHEIMKLNLKSLIDIGTGSGDILEILCKIKPDMKLTAVDLNNYHNLDCVKHVTADLTQDSAREKISGKYEVLTCLDCLEHFEEIYIRDILEMFSRLSETFLFSIANHSDIVDSVELHLIQKGSTWWTNILSEFFEITYFESLCDNRLYLYKCKRKK